MRNKVRKKAEQKSKNPVSLFFALFLLFQNSCLVVLLLFFSKSGMFFFALVFVVYFVYSLKVGLRHFTKVDMFLANIRKSVQVQQDVLQHLGKNCNSTNDFMACIKDTVRQTLAIEVAECPCFLHKTLSSLRQIS